MRDPLRTPLLEAAREIAGMPVVLLIKISKSFYNAQRCINERCSLLLKTSQQSLRNFNLYLHNNQNNEMRRYVNDILVFGYLGICAHALLVSAFPRGRSP